MREVTWHRCLPNAMGRCGTTCIREFQGVAAEISPKAKLGTNFWVTLFRETSKNFKACQHVVWQLLLFPQGEYMLYIPNFHLMRNWKWIWSFPSMQNILGILSGANRDLIRLENVSSLYVYFFKNFLNSMGNCKWGLSSGPHDSITYFLSLMEICLEYLQIARVFSATTSQLESQLTPSFTGLETAG